MYKVIELLKRRPGMEVTAFQQHLLERHAPLLQRASELLRCVLSPALPQGYAKGELLFDAIAEYWFTSEAGYLAFRKSLAGAAAAADESRFLDTARKVVMPVDVHVIKDGVIPLGAVKNIEFVNRRPGMPLEAFRRYWHDVHGPIAAKIPVLRRYEQNHLKAEVYGVTPNPPYDGLAITWFASTSDMKQGTKTPEYAATRADEPNFLPDGHLPILITKEYVLTDRTQPHSP